MAEQTIALPAAAHLTTATRREWLWLARTDDPRIDDDLTPPGNPARFVVNLRLYRASTTPSAERAVVLHLESAASETQFSAGEDLSDAFEARGSLTVTTGEHTLTCLQRLSGDTQEQYRYDPGDGYTVDEFDAVFGALGGSQASKSGELVIRDYEPGRSIGGLAFGGRKITGGAYAGRKITGGAYAGRKFRF